MNVSGRHRLGVKQCRRGGVGWPRPPAEQYLEQLQVAGEALVQVLSHARLRAEGTCRKQGRSSTTHLDRWRDASQSLQTNLGLHGLARITRRASCSR